MCHSLLTFYHPSTAVLFMWMKSRLVGEAQESFGPMSTGAWMTLLTSSPSVKSFWLGVTTTRTSYRLIRFVLFYACLLTTRIQSQKQKAGWNLLPSWIHSVYMLIMLSLGALRECQNSLWSLLERPFNMQDTSYYSQNSWVQTQQFSIQSPSEYCVCK